MESEVMKVTNYALEQSNVSGYLCVDRNGLCIAAGGNASESMSGIIHEIANLASKIEQPKRNSGAPSLSEPPVVRVDMDRQKILIQSREGMTTALFSPQK